MMPDQKNNSRLADLFATGYKQEFPDDAQRLLAGRAAHLYTSEKVFDTELLSRRLREECTGSDGTVYVSDSEIALAIAAALDKRKQLLDGSLAGKIVAEGHVVKSSETEHVRDLASQVQSWKDLEGFGFGVYEFDRAFGGLYPGEILTVVGGPGSMKTSLALNAVDHYLRNYDRSVLFFSLDMPAKAIACRRLMRELDAFQNEIYAMLRDDDPKVKIAMERMNASDRGRYKLIGKKRGGKHYSWEEMRDIIVQVAPELVIVDYLTCIGDYRNDTEAVRDLMPKIAGAAEDYGIAFILLSHISRSSRADMKDSSGGHGAGGHYIEAAADIEIELFKQTTEGHSDYIATVTKTRKAASGRSYMLNYSHRTMQFLTSCNEVRRATKPKKIFEI